MRTFRQFASLAQRRLRPALVGAALSAPLAAQEPDALPAPVESIGGDVAPADAPFGWLPGAPADGTARVEPVDADRTLSVVRFDASDTWWLLRAADGSVGAPDDSTVVAHELATDPGRRWALEQRDLDGDGVRELLRHAIDSALPPCPGTTTYVDPAVWSAGEGRFRAVAVRPPAATETLASYTGPAVADVLPYDAVPRGVSSGADGGGVGPAPGAWADGGAASAWQPSGSGIGAFVRIDIATGAALQGLEIDRTGSEAAVDLRWMAAGTVYGVRAPADSVTRVILPAPIDARCAVVAVARVEAGPGALDGAGGDAVAIRRLRAVTAVDLAPAGLAEQMRAAAFAAPDAVAAAAAGRGFRGAPPEALDAVAGAIRDVPGDQADAALRLAAALVAAEAPDALLERALASGLAPDVALELARGIAAPSSTTLAAAAAAGLPGAALRTLAERGDASARVWLIGQLGVGGDPDRAATIALLGASEPAVRAALVAQLAGAPRDAALDTLLALWSGSGALPDPDGAVVERIADPDASVARAALRVAGRTCAAGAQPAITHALDDPQQWIRATAVEAMADLWRCAHDPAAAAAVLRALDDVSATVRLTAAGRVLEVGGDAGRAALAARRVTETWPEVLQAIDAAQAIHQQGPSAPVDPPVDPDR